MKKRQILIEVNLPDTDKIVGKFPSTFKLKQIANWIKKKCREEKGKGKGIHGHLYQKGSYKFFIVQPHPKTIYDVETETKEIGELFGQKVFKNFFYSKENKAILTIKDKETKKDIEKGEGTIQEAKYKGVVDHALKLKGDPKMEEFRKKKKEEEALVKKKEEEEKKMRLLKVRMELEHDKLKRMDKVWVKKEDEDKVEVVEEEKEVL